PGFEYTFTDGAELDIADIDNNGINDIIIAGDTHLVIVQPKIYLYNMFTEPAVQYLSVSQGEIVDFVVTIRDRNIWPVVGADTALLVRKSGSETFLSFFGVDQGNGKYTITLNTAVWSTGIWQLYITAKHSFYNDIEITDYMDFNGNYVNSLGTITNHGEINPDYTFSGETGTFSVNTLSGVVELSTIYLKVAVEDNYYNKLSDKDINVTVNFNGKKYLANYTNKGEFTLNISTSGIEYQREKYNLIITINGPYFEIVSRTFYVEIIPLSPMMEFSKEFLTNTAILTLVIFTVLLWGMRIVYRSLDDNPQIVLRVLGITSLFIAASIVITLVVGNSALSIDPMFTFLATLLAFGEIILFFFFWFFRHIYKRIITLKFAPLTWLPVGFFVILIVILISINLLVATEIDWFNYKMYISTVDVFFFQDVPKLYVDILVTGFASGFLIVIVTASLETHNNIEKLKMVKEKVEEGYYLKEPNKLIEEMAKESATSFNSLLKSFTLWYVIIIFTFLTVFEIYYLTPLLLAVLLPALLIATVLLREPIIGAIVLTIPMSKNYRMAINKQVKKRIFAVTMVYYIIAVGIYLYLEPAIPQVDYLISITIVYLLILMIYKVLLSAIRFVKNLITESI
ncbi:MAG: hypothetical protein ACXADY_10110, partial [Candidatus Hodarchaeales archaeon]